MKVVVVISTTWRIVFLRIFAVATEDSLCAAPTGDLEI